MKLNKTIFIMCIAVLGILMVAQSSHAYTMMVNLSQKTDGPDVGKKVDDAVKNAGKEGSKLASNEALTTQMIDEIKTNSDARVTLNGKGVVEVIPGVTDPIGYAIGAGSVRLNLVSKTGNAYDFTDSTISPLIFSETFATGETQQFAEAVTAMQPDQIAVIIAINMTSDDIKKAIEGKIDLGKVVIVEATTVESQTAFSVLFSDNKEGFSLRSLDRNNPVVIKALQGAV